MIPVAPHGPPPTYATAVQSPGAKYLTDFPVAPPVPSEHWDGHKYWQKVQQQLWAAYEGFCCYCCIYIEPSCAYWGTCDHFRPTSLHPHLAYTWANFRLASTVTNQRKRNHEDVVDPFVVQDGWFSINEATLKVEVGPAAPPGTTQDLEDTITRLNLNGAYHMSSRRRAVDRFLTGQTTLAGLEAEAPFVAREIERWTLQPYP